MIKNLNRSLKSRLARSARPNKERSRLMVISMAKMLLFSVMMDKPPEKIFTIRMKG